MRKRLLIVGTHGIPAKYGGFETMIEQITPFLLNYKVGVTCSSKMKGGPNVYNGIRLHYINLSASGYQSPFYDTLSMILSVVHGYDIVLYLGPTFGVSTIIPWLFRKQVVLNFGGLDEWSRPKYPWLIRKLIWTNFFIASKVAKARIADNTVIKSSIEKNFKVIPEVIRYGGDHVLGFQPQEISSFGLPGRFALVVARAQKDTLLKEIIDSWNITSLPLVIVSNWSTSQYGLEAKQLGNQNDKVKLLDAIYEQDVLNSIRSKAYIYIHTHTLCGTSPSLVEAISLELPIISVDRPTNRETTKNGAHYWKSTKELVQFISSKSFNYEYVLKLKENSVKLKNEYNWKSISDEYIRVIDRLD
jgi:glycosyltransferase involved in cell wall biosynthesis